MSSYQINSLNQTATFIKTGLVLTALLLNQPVMPIDGSGDPDFFQKAYASTGPSPTFDQYRGLITHDFVCNEDPLLRTVSDFYESLLRGQEGLGEDFQRVLSENLWDLYES